MSDKRKALGRGIDALIPRSAPVAVAVPGPTEAAGSFGEPRTCAVEEIMPNRFQPRRLFNDESLAELAASIEEKGILEPLLVRPLPADAKSDHTAGVAYELIAGERRWRAAQKAGLTRVPVVISKMSDQEALEAALIENVLRDDLTPIEEAEGYQRLLDTAHLTQEELSARIGRNRVHIANTVRLLKLPRAVREEINSGVITAGHGRALLAMDDDIERARLHKAILSKNLSVRQTEKLVQQIQKVRAAGEAPAARRPTPGAPEPRDPYYESLGRDLSRELGATVTVTPKGGRGGSQGGRVVIHCASPTSLDKVITRLRGEK